MAPSPAVAPPLESAPGIPAEANPPSTTITTAAPETTSTTIAAPSPHHSKLSQWWELHRDGIMTSVIKVFEVTSKVLDMAPLAKPATKAFENAAKVLEEVQVFAFLGGLFSTVCIDERANSANLGECRHRPRFDSENGAHHRRS
jgi:hypothetical protein